MRGLDFEELWQLCAIVDGGPGTRIYISGRVFVRLEARGLVRRNYRGRCCADCGKSHDWGPSATKLGRWLRAVYATGQIPMMA